MQISSVRLFDIVLLVQIGIALWIVSVLLSRIKYRISNFFLALAPIGGLLYLIRSLVELNEIYMQYQILLFLPIYWPAIIGPTVYIFLLDVIQSQEKVRWSNLFHLSPILINLSYQTYWFFQSFEVRLDYYAGRYSDFDKYVEQIISVIITFVYLIAAKRVGSGFIKRNRNKLTSKSLSIVTWANNYIFLLILTFSLFAIIVSIDLLLPAVGDDVILFLKYIFYFWVTTFIIWLAIHVTNNLSLTTERIEFSRSAAKNIPFETRLRELTLARIFDPDLGPYPIHTLAKLLGTDTMYLGKYLKIHFNTNYLGYVRQIRMERFQSLARERNNYNGNLAIKDIQLLCGYRNRASFNRDVQEVFHKSPSEFILSLKQQLN